MTPEPGSPPDYHQATSDPQPPFHQMREASILEVPAPSPGPTSSDTPGRRRTRVPAVGVIWDLDGTLADTERAHFLAWQRFCLNFDRVLTWEQFKPTFGLSNPDVLRMLISSDLSDDDLQRLSDEKEALFRNTPGAILPMPGSVKLARHLHALSIPQAIGSSAPPENIPYVLEALGVADLFVAIVCRWDVEQGKPAPDIFLRAAEKIGLPPINCIVLEDAPPGITAAHAAGMRCIALEGTWPAETLRNADYRVATLADIVWERTAYAEFASGAWKPS